MAILLLTLLGALAIWMIFLAFKNANLNNRIEEIQKSLKRGGNETDRQVREAVEKATREINEKAERALSDKLRELAGTLSSSPSALNAIAEKIVTNLLRDPQLSEEFLRTLTLRIVNKEAVFNEVMERAMKKIPDLEETLMKKIEEIVENNEDWDAMQEAVVKSMPGLIEQLFADPEKRVRILKIVWDDIDGRLEEEVRAAFEDYNYDDDQIDPDDVLNDQICAIVKTELENPESELRKKLADAVIEAVKDKFDL